MHAKLPQPPGRIESIDVLRGIVMVIMALDHVRDYIHIDANIADPLNVTTTTPILYFTRWITHFCAPVFVFLSGVSIYLQSLRKTKKELSLFLFKRGAWLILVEFFIISLAWTFNPYYNIIPLQVIWAIGISMVLLGLVIQLPFKLILALGLLIVFGHNLLDVAEAAPGFKPGFWWDLLHSGRFTPYAFGKQHYVLIVYPFLAWTGVMMLGYCTGMLFTPAYSAGQRKKILHYMGISLLGIFILLRYFNLYGNPSGWAVQKNAVLSFLSFLNVHKYPPSLLYLCVTIGIALLFLPLLERIQNGFTRRISVFGRTAFFYYILHIYLVHAIATTAFFMRGEHTVQEAILSMQNLPFLFVIPGEGYSLGIAYLVWIAVILILYPLCKWYDRYKRNHKEKTWLSYL